MSIQSIIMKNRRLTNLFMSSMPAGAWEKMGKKNAILTLKSIVKNIPAYRDFLKQNGLKLNKIKRSYTIK